MLKIHGLWFRVWDLQFVVFGAWGFRVSGLQIVSSAFVLKPEPPHIQSNFGPTYHPGLDENCQKVSPQFLTLTTHTLNWNPKPAPLPNVMTV